MASTSLGAFILTFKRPEMLKTSLDRLLSQSRPPDYILVVDNAASAETRQQVEEYGNRMIAYETPGENIGSAGGTAYGVARIAELGHDLIFCGDDDNPPRTDDTLARLLELLASSPPEVGAVGTVGTRWDWRRGVVERLADQELEGTVEVDFIGGGHRMILRRETVDTVGTPDPRLFFGYPDLEHCLRLRRGGYRLLVDGGLMRFHREAVGRLGYRPQRSMLPRRPLTGIWRCYYTTRNYIYMMRYTFERPDLARRRVANALLHSLTGWARGPRYGARLARFHLRGIRDGYRGRLGPTVKPQAKK